MRIVGKFTLRATLPDGSKQVHVAHNTPTHEGLLQMIDASLDRFYYSETTWRFGWVDETGFTAYDQADTLSSHAGWSEKVQIGGRWGVSNLGETMAGDYLSCVKTLEKSWASISTDFDARGLFLCTTTNNTGKLWCTADFEGGPISLPSGSSLTVTYECTLSSA